ncbi:MAG: hypothetical protein AB2A00_19825 [Myxococcota bacterium]
MMRRVLVACAALLLPASSADVAREEHGSLIVAVRSTGGLALCADKRRITHDGKHVDDQVKLRRLGPRAVAAHAGLRWAFSGDGTHFFDPAVVLEEVYRRVGLEDPTALLQAFAEEVHRRYAPMLPSTRPPPGQPDHGGRGHILFTTVVFSVDKGGRMGIARVTFRFDEVPPEALRHDVKVFPDQQNVVAFGNTKFLEELLGARKDTHPEARKDPGIAAALSHHEPLLPEKMALRFARRLIVHASRANTAWPDVSPTSDCGVLRRTGAFDEVKR